MSFPATAYLPTFFLLHRHFSAQSCRIWPGFELNCSNAWCALNPFRSLCPGVNHSLIRQSVTERPLLSKCSTDLIKIIAFHNVLSRLFVMWDNIFVNVTFLLSYYLVITFDADNRIHVKCYVSVGKIKVDS